MNDLSPPAMAIGRRITAHAFVAARLSDIAALRNRPTPPGGPTLPARFLRHADEHTVVGIHAVLDAIATARSLHSVAGAVSVALGMHGPHLGVGGGPDALGEGILAATTLLMSGGDPACTAVWLVATEWNEEPALDSTGSMSGLTVYRHADREPVVMTGVAAISPLGADVPTILDNLFAGASGIREIEVDERARTESRFAGTVAEIPVPPGMEPEAFRGLDRLEPLSRSSDRLTRSRSLTLRSPP